MFNFKMIRSKIYTCLCAGLVGVCAPSVQAITVDLELILAADVSGSIDSTDFSLQRSGFEDAFRSSALISAIESGVFGSIAVTLWDFSNDVSVGVDWTIITDAASSNAFADAIALAPRGFSGGGDGQSNLINLALTSLNTNNFEGTRSLLDIASEGAQDLDGCSSFNVDCPIVQEARDNFLAGGGTAINAIWLNDRDYFGLDPEDAINAYEYGTTNVIGGEGSFQDFAYDFTDFAPAIEAKIIREVSGVPEPTTLALMSLGLIAIGLRRRRML